LCSSVAWGQGFAGIYLGNSEAGTVTVELSLVGEELAGRLSAQEVEFALEGFVQDGVGVGFAHTASGSLGFEAYLEGNTLGLYLFEMDSSGAPIVESVVELLLTRRAEAVAAAGSSTPASPPPAGTSSSQANPSSQPADQVLATGAYATLTYGNAEAFIEALEFVLAQLGYVYDFTEAERAEGLRSIAANYPAMNQMDQVVLSQARDILDRVKVNW